MPSMLTGAEKSRLRAQGQLLEPSLKIGREGATASVLRELGALLAAHSLVKVRFTAADRVERETLRTALEAGTESACVGQVGATALFFRRPEGSTGKKQ